MGRQYTHVQVIEKEMLEMKAAGKTNREIAEEMGFKDKYVVKEWVKRYNRRMRKREAGIDPRRRDVYKRQVVNRAFFILYNRKE